MYHSSTKNMTRAFARASFFLTETTSSKLLVLLRTSCRAATHGQRVNEENGNHNANVVAFVLGNGLRNPNHILSHTRCRRSLDTSHFLRHFTVSLATWIPGTAYSYSVHVILFVERPKLVLEKSPFQKRGRCLRRSNLRDVDEACVSES